MDNNGYSGQGRIARFLCGKNMFKKKQGRSLGLQMTTKRRLHHKFILATVCARRQLTSKLEEFTGWG